MEGEFSEVKRRTNNKLTDEKMKKQLPIVRSPADGQDDSSTKENAANKNAKPSVNSNKQATANPNQIVAACKAQSQEKTKYFGIDFMEAPLPKINPWTRNQGASSDLENGAEVEITCSKNTNAAELSEGSPKNRGDECPESNCHIDCDGKTDTSPTKGRACQRNAIQPETRTVPAHNSYQAHNPAYKTSNKPKNWDKKHKETKQNTDLNDSAQWPSLDIVTDKNKQEQPSARPKLPSQKADESNESDAESQAKPDSPTGDIIENVNTQQNKKKNKQKWVQLPIEMKTERRRGGSSNGSRGRGSSRPQYFNEDQARRSNRTTFRKPNKTRDGSRQGQSDDVEARVLDENERNQCIFIGVQSAPINRNISYRGRRGRGRGGYTRGPRDSTNHVIEESLPVQPFFAPVFVADEVDIPILTEVQSEGSIVADVQQSEQKENKIKLQMYDFQSVNKEYYFSEKNLQKDAYLRHMMDGAGWVDMDVISAFPRVKTLGVNRDDVARAMVRSDVVEMAEDGQKLRTKVEPAKWPLKPGVEIEDAHIPRWKALSSNSKLKADAPVFVPGKQYMSTNCMNTSQSSNMGSNHYCMDSMNPGQNERN